MFMFMFYVNVCFVLFIVYNICPLYYDANLFNLFSIVKKWIGNPLIDTLISSDIPEISPIVIIYNRWW